MINKFVFSVLLDRKCVLLSEDKFDIEAHNTILQTTILKKSRWGSTSVLVWLLKPTLIIKALESYF